MASLKLSQTELKKRINDPNEDRGPYFYKKKFEVEQEQKTAAAAPANL